MKSASKYLGLLSLVLLLAPLAYGATVTGTVKGPDGASFRGAFVQAQDSNTKILVSVLTDKEGRYRIENLPPGQYQLQVKAVGYRTDPRPGVILAADQNASYEFDLQKGAVRWSDLSQYQGEKLFPDAKGKDLLVGRCFACHGFQSRMAPVRRDEEGWRDRVNYMMESMHFFLGGLGAPFSDQNAADVTSYINSLFGENSVLPKSPAEMPAYKDLVRSFGDDAMKIVYVEYDLPGPGRMPWSAFPDKDGNFWMPYYGKANKIGRLDPKTGEVQDAYNAGKEGTVAGGSKHTLRIDAQGRVWTTGGPLTVFDPKTGKFTQI